MKQNTKAEIRTNSYSFKKFTENNGITVNLTVTVKKDFKGSMWIQFSFL